MLVDFTNTVVSRLRFLLVIRVSRNEIFLVVSISNVKFSIELSSNISLIIISSWNQSRTNTMSSAYRQ